MTVLLLMIGASLLIIGMIEAYRGKCGLAEDACTILGGFSVGVATVRLLMEGGVL